jgi:uncharacterized protein
MSDDKKRLAVLVSHNANGDKSTIAFTIANAALSSGMEVLVFLVSDGVELCREGAADQAHTRPFQPLEALMDTFIANGGILAACGSCFQYRGMSPDHNAHGVEVSGVGLLAKWLAQGATTVSL